MICVFSFMRFSIGLFCPANCPCEFAGKRWFVQLKDVINMQGSLPGGVPDSSSFEFTTCRDVTWRRDTQRVH